jgi:hypothetical protein
VAEPRRALVLRLTTKKLRRGAHTSVRELNRDIRAWITTWNDDPRPYIWTKTADQILEPIKRYCTTITDSPHQLVAGVLSVPAPGRNRGLWMGGRGRGSAERVAGLADAGQRVSTARTARDELGAMPF